MTRLWRHLGSNLELWVIYFPANWGSDLEPHYLPNHRVEGIWNDARLGSFTPTRQPFCWKKRCQRWKENPWKTLPFVFPAEWKATFTMYDDEVVYGHKLHGHAVNGLAGLNPHGASEYGLLLPGTTKLGSLAALLQRVWLPPTCWSQLILLLSHRILYFPDLEADVPPRTSYESNAAGVRTTNWMMEEEEEEVDGRMMDSLDQVLSEGRFLGLVTTRSAPLIESVFGTEVLKAVRDNGIDFDSLAEHLHRSADPEAYMNK